MIITTATTTPIIPTMRYVFDLFELDVVLDRCVVGIVDEEVDVVVVVVFSGAQESA